MGSHYRLWEKHYKGSVGGRPTSSSLLRPPRLEDARAQAAYGVNSGVNKVLIINRELVPGRITVVFVDEVLGFN